MRIVGGTLAGRKFGGKAGPDTRPTAERVREAIASAIESRGGFVDARVLDLFAGTGAMAFEAISRGARGAVLVERERRAARAIVRSAGELGIAGRCTVIASDLRATGTVERIARSDLAPFDRVFVDPPYAEVECVGPLLEALAGRALLAPGCLLAIEHGKRHNPALPEGFAVLSHRWYGDTAVLIVTIRPTGDEVPR